MIKLLKKENKDNSNSRKQINWNKNAMRELMQHIKQINSEIILSDM